MCLLIMYLIYIQKQDLAFKKTNNDWYAIKPKKKLAQLAGAAEYTHWFSTEG